MIPLVHHPDYLTAPEPGSPYKWNKNGMIREAAIASGAAVNWVEAAVMPDEWLTRVHCPD